MILIIFLQILIHVVIGEEEKDTMMMMMLSTTTTNTKVLGANHHQTPSPLPIDDYLFLKHHKNDSIVVSCQDFRPNCGIFHALCNNTRFDEMMKQECPMTCGICNDLNVTDKSPLKNESEQATTQAFNMTSEMPEFSSTTKVMNREFSLLPDIQSISTNKEVTAVSASSLSKTIIKGTCFDEYIYCAEFVAMCFHGEYAELMARHCSLSCDRCEVQHKERETCKDDAECDGMKALCNHEIYHGVMEKQCRRTCGICVAEADGCKDRHKNCAGFKDDGFCENPIYSSNERSYLCGQTCQLC